MQRPSADLRIRTGKNTIDSVRVQRRLRAPGSEMPPRRPQRVDLCMHHVGANKCTVVHKTDTCLKNCNFLFVDIEFGNSIAEGGSEFVHRSLTYTEGPCIRRSGFAVETLQGFQAKLRRGRVQHWGFTGVPLQTELAKWAIQIYRIIV